MFICYEKLKMKLTNFFGSDQVYRNTSFNTTYSPHHKAKYSIAYSSSSALIKQLNNDEFVSCIIVTEELVDLVDKSKGVVISKNPQKTYYTLHNQLFAEGYIGGLDEYYIDPSSEISEKAIVSDKVWIGKNVKIGVGVIIKDFTIIQENSIIEDYAIIGASGMQNTRVDNENFIVKNAGGVKIGKNTIIYTSAIVQKPYHDFFTEIGDHTKVANQVVVGHGVRVGNNVMISGKSIIAGNSCIGDHVWIGASVTIRDNITIGNNTKIRIGSVLINNVLEGEDVSGNFALNHKKNMFNFLKLKKAWSK